MLEAPPSSARLSVPLAFIRRVLMWPAQVAQTRRTMAFLGQMSDRELLDIGLLRSDLANCAALPLDEDPTDRLAAARAARAWFPPRRAIRETDAVFDVVASLPTLAEATFAGEGECRPGGAALMRA